MNLKPFLLTQIFHQFKNCKHLKNIVTFLCSFGHYKYFLPKLQILVAKIYIDLSLIFENAKMAKSVKILISVNAKKGFVGPA